MCCICFVGNFCYIRKSSITRILTQLLKRNIYQSVEESNDSLGLKITNVRSLATNADGCFVVPPLFPPSVWNVHDATLAGRERTNNVCEGWNHAFANTVGHQHPSLLVLIGALQRDQALTATALLQDARGPGPKKNSDISKHVHVQAYRKILILLIKT